MKKTSYTLVFLDTETTGLGEYDRFCQLAYSINGKVVNELFKPPVEMNIGAMSVHKITPDMLKDKPAFKDSEHFTKLQTILSKPNTILVAHNAPFDVKMLKREGIEVPLQICTLKIASKLLTDKSKAKNNKLQTLREYFNVQLDDAIAHDAAGDIAVLEVVFNHLYDIAFKAGAELRASLGKSEPTRDEILRRMIKLTMSPDKHIETMPFGKHAGTRLEDLVKNQPNYCKWLISEKEKSGDVDDVYLTLKELLRK